VTELRAALDVYDSLHSRFLWAKQQIGLGLALQDLAAIEPGEQRLQEAATALRAALIPELTQGRMGWIDEHNVYNALGGVLRELAMRQGRPACDAVASHWQALQFVPAPRGAAITLAKHELERDRQNKPAPTPALCPEVPTEAWLPINEVPAHE
jgi:hypothetical protein